MSTPTQTSILDLAAAGEMTNVVREMRVRSLYSPYYFSKVILGYSDLVDHFHQVEMERFVTNWSAGQSLQVVEWARAFFKTTCFTVSTSIWVTLPVNEEDTSYALDTLHIPEGDWYLRTSLHDQDATQLLAFENAENAAKKIGTIKWHFEENNLFRSIFPEIAYQGSEQPWNNKCLRIRRVGARRKDPEGTFEAIGVGGALQSRHYKIVWLDDLVGESARKSESVMSDTIGWFQRLHGAFEDATKQIKFVVANRWGYNDLNSHIRANEPEFVFHTRAAVELSTESGQEEPVFPERYNWEGLEKIKNKMTDYDYSCQYLNNPTLPGEREITLDQIHLYRVGELGEMICSCGATWKLSQCLRWMHFDPYNAKGAASKSLPCLIVTATAPDKHYFLVDYFTGRVDYGKLYDRIFHFNDIYRPQAFTYEDVGHQNMTEHHIKKVTQTAEYKTAHRAFCRILPVTTGNRAKEIRIRENLFPILEKGKFSRRAKHTLFDSMLETFPNPRLGDDYDLLDALAQGPAVWRFPLDEITLLETKEGEDTYLKQFGQPYAAGVIQ